MLKRLHRPIVAGLIISEGDHYVTEHGDWWNPYYVDRVRDYQEYFEARLLEKVDATLGHSNWAINFVQMSALEEIFLVDLYCDDPKEYAMLCTIVENCIPKDFSLQYFPMGNIERYMSKN